MVESLAIDDDFWVRVESRRTPRESPIPGGAREPDTGGPSFWDSRAQLLDFEEVLVMSITGPPP
jgi:hypothetical protein